MGLVLSGMTAPRTMALDWGGATEWGLASQQVSPHPAALFEDELEIKLADVGCGGGRIPCTAPQSYGAPTLPDRAAYRSAAGVLDELDTTMEIGMGSYFRVKSGDLRLKAEGPGGVRLDDRQESDCWRLLTAWLAEKDVNGNGSRFSSITNCSSCCAVRQMKQVLCASPCDAPTGPQRQHNKTSFHPRLAQSMFIGVICFVSGSGWFVSAHMRGSGELAGMGNGGSQASEQRSRRVGYDELSSCVSDAVSRRSVVRPCPKSISGFFGQAVMILVRVAPRGATLNSGQKDAWEELWDEALGSTLRPTNQLRGGVVLGRN